MTPSGDIWFVRSRAIISPSICHRRCDCHRSAAQGQLAPGGSGPTRRVTLGQLDAGRHRQIRSGEGELTHYPMPQSKGGPIRSTSTTRIGLPPTGPPTRSSVSTRRPRPMTFPATSAVPTSARCSAARAKPGAGSRARSGSWWYGTELEKERRTFPPGAAERGRAALAAMRG
jgi:hypothetical protein